MAKYIVPGLILILIVSCVFIFYFESVMVKNVSQRTISSSSPVANDDFRRQTLINLGHEVRTLVFDFLATAHEPKTCQQSNCGFGCTVHSLIHCAFWSLEQNRSFTIGLSKNGFASKSFESVFEPLPFVSDTIDHLQITTMKENQDQIGWKRSVPFELKMIPTTIRRRVTELHPNPTAWWSGQIGAVILQLQPKYQSVVDEFANDSQPIVGIHVRRTDKASEADFVPIEDYLKQAEAWFGKYESNLRSAQGDDNAKVARRLYIATDDPEVVGEAKLKFPHYEFIYDFESQVATKVNQRKTDEGYQSVALDVARLAKCNFVVCTFSSSICRLAFELMQVRLGDASNALVSVDLPYLFRWRIQPQAHRVILSQRGSKSSQAPKKHSRRLMELRVGDLIEPETWDWDSALWFGRNQRTNMKGYYQGFRIEPVFLVS